MEILTAKEALNRLDALDITGLTETNYNIGTSGANYAINVELNKIFRFLEDSYATDEYLNQLDAKYDTVFWLVGFLKEDGKWLALFCNDSYKEIWIDL